MYFRLNYLSGTVSEILIEAVQNCKPTPMVVADEANDHFDLMCKTLDWVANEIGDVVRLDIDPVEVFSIISEHGVDTCYDEMDATSLLQAFTFDRQRFESKAKVVRKQSF